MLYIGLGRWHIQCSGSWWAPPIEIKILSIVLTTNIFLSLSYFCIFLKKFFEVVSGFCGWFFVLMTFFFVFTMFVSWIEYTINYTVIWHYKSFVNLFAKLFDFYSYILPIIGSCFCCQVYLAIFLRIKQTGTSISKRIIFQKSFIFKSLKLDLKSILFLMNGL